MSFYCKWLHFLNKLKYIQNLINKKEVDSMNLVIIVSEDT
jgi:hypothetical protein